MTFASWRFGGAAIKAELQSLGGMLGPVEVTVDGRKVQLFAVAPWADDVSEEHRQLPGILQRLRGEWVCVPFGADAQRPALPDDWQPKSSGIEPLSDVSPHGYSSNHHWHLVTRSNHSITIGIDYPAEHPIRRVTRTITADPYLPVLDFTLEIHARRDCRLPLGLHPVYVLPAEPGSLKLHIAPTARAWTFPVEVELGRIALLPDQRDVAPEALRSVHGGSCDLRHLPFPGESEDLALLTGLDGGIVLVYEELGYAVTQSWDPVHFPACLLWISSQGRQYYPWSGRFRGIGIEPVAAPFDLGAATAASGEDPLARSGVPTSVALQQATPFTTEYRISVSSIGKGDTSP